jgi:hypothetical protein
MSIRGTSSRNGPSIAAERWVGIAFVIFAAALCWEGVSWALQPGLTLMMDEIMNPARFVNLNASYWDVITFFPHIFYNDRPVGLAFEKLLFDAFGFRYLPQLICFLLVHFTNCVMVFFLSKRLGIRSPLALATVGLFGSLWTTASTATYLGAVFDLLALFWLLISFHVFLSKIPGAVYLSLVLYVLALRSKEFAISAPILYAILTALDSRSSTLRETLTSVARRTWPHFLTGLFFMAYYARLGVHYENAGPYSLRPDARVILDSVSYYTALIFGMESAMPSVWPVLLAIAVYAAARRHIALLFVLSAYLLMLLPVSMLPNMRSSIYTYAPQVFLFLMVAILVQDLFDVVFASDRVKWAAEVGLAIIVMAWAVRFQQSDYFQNRVRFTMNARRISTRSAVDAQAVLSEIKSGTRIYVNHGANRPWLFVPGPCDYFKLATRASNGIECVLQQPEEKLLAAYRSDRGAKLLLQQDADGRLTLIDKGN